MSQVLLKADATCPNCLQRFAPEDVLWIAGHQSLVGDRKLPGEDAMMRFLPTRFTVDGFAIDPGGMVSKKLACPCCHLEIPRCVLDIRINFFSIIGTSGAGKSFYLASMIHEMRKVMKTHFDLKFFDPDPTFNKALLDNENNIFYNKDPKKAVSPNSLVEKTQHLHQNLYHQVRVNGQIVNYAKPFIFQVDPLKDEEIAPKRRLVVLYGNSGESFRLGMDNDSDLVTVHMANAFALLFLFDPTQYPGFKQAAETALPGSMKTNQSYGDNRQEVVLTESVSRIRRYKGLGSSAKYDRPLIVVLSKWDTWCHLTPGAIGPSPYVKSAGPGGQLNLPEIKKTSDKMRELLNKHAPNIVLTCESFATHVYYLPASAFGRAPKLDETGKIGLVCPQEINPIWVTVPLTLALALTTRDLVPFQKITKSNPSLG